MKIWIGAPTSVASLLGGLLATECQEGMTEKGVHSRCAIDVVGKSRFFGRGALRMTLSARAS